MGKIEQREVAGIAYREAAPERACELVPALCLHGFPETSYMWRDVLAALSASGRRAIAPDLAGFGDSPPDPPGTWERHVEAVERFRRELGLERLALVLHDWGGLIGLRWACEHPEEVAGLVISNTGFFPDGKWHGMARSLRTPGEGEKLVAAIDREGFIEMLGSASPGIDEAVAAEYWKSFDSPEGRQGILDLYRSGDFSKLEAYEGRLAALDVPTLLLWGDKDPFAPVAGAHRLQGEIPNAKTVVLDAGHFVFADQPEGAAAAVVDFLVQSEV